MFEMAFLQRADFQYVTGAKQTHMNRTDTDAFFRQLLCLCTPLPPYLTHQRLS